MAIPLVIDELWAWVSSDVEGEGVLAAPMKGMGAVPLVGADRERMESLRPLATQLGNMFGVGVSLVRFTHRELIENIQPVVPDGSDGGVPGLQHD